MWKCGAALFIVLIAALAIIIYAQPPSQSGVGIANPSATFCEDQGYTYEIRTAEDGSQSGVCIGNGKECDGWAFYRGECSLA